MKKVLFFVLILIFITQACSLPMQSVEMASSTPIVPGKSYLLITPAPNATATPTPFQPLPITPTPIPTATPTPEPTPTLGIEAPDVQMPRSPYGVPEGGAVSGDVVNLLILGSDARPGGGFRTDVIVLVSIHRNDNTIRMVSFPRDLYVEIPGWMTNRINTAFAAGGFNTLAYTFEYNFGVRPTYYVMTNMQAFTSIIDSMGGINVKVRKSLSDKCDLPWADGRGYCTIEAPATVPMDGKTALWYVRSRYSSSDFDRLRRAQEVLYAIFQKLMSLDGISRAPEIYAAYVNSVETNLTLDTLLTLVPVAQEVMQNPDRIQRYTLSPAEAAPYITPEGAWVLWPNLYAIRAIVYDAVYR